MTSRATGTNEVQREDQHGTAASGAWSEGEEQALLGEFRRGCSLDELAGLHRRAVHDVQSRLVSLGQIERAARPEPTTEREARR
jgi:hypothetical protein